MQADFLQWKERHFGAVATVERTEHPVIVAPRDRVVLVIMTACTCERQAQHG